jgi:signal transduction histidine kinase
LLIILILILVPERKSFFRLIDKRKQSIENTKFKIFKWYLPSMKETLLIIDDTPDNVAALVYYLTNKGFTVLIAQDGEEGIKMAQCFNPHLILLDVMMPNLDGFEVCKIIKSNEQLKNIPIFFLTALIEPLDKVKGLELGAVDYITKPLQNQEVYARITLHLRLRRLQQRLEEQNQQLQEEIVYRKQTQEHLQKTTQDLVKRTQELEQRNLELDAFAHTVAHDLKNPLGGIMGFCDLLLDECTTMPPCYENCIERLDYIKLASEQMFNIIDALLLLAGVSRQGQMQPHALDMSKIISQVIQQRLNYMLRHYSTAEIIVPDSWPLAFGYAPWVEEIWVNYMSNGLKYGGNPPCLELGSDLQGDNMIRFWIHDNGPGLSLQAQSQLFTPFTRLHVKRAKGHGLGLSIVQQIVTKLGGQAGVESTLGEGSLFYFTLPTYASK